MNVKNAQWLTDRELVGKSIEILRVIDGLPVSQGRRVLQEAERLLGDVTRLDCGATRFLQYVEELPLFPDESI